MNSEQENQELGVLQHEAEHERPHRPNSVLFYLMILFAAAFLLLLLSFFSQQRANQVAIDNLQQTSNSATESLRNLIAERDTLLAERDALNQENSSLQGQMEDLQGRLHSSETALAQDQADLAAALAREAALNQLNQIRALYNQRRNREARALLAQYPDLEEQLTSVSQGLTEEERDIYDPLDAYRSIVSVLNP